MFESSRNLHLQWGGCDSADVTADRSYSQQMLDPHQIDVSIFVHIGI